MKEDETMEVVDGESSTENGATPSEVVVADPSRYEQLIEALVFASGDPISATRISEVTKIPLETVEPILEALVTKHTDRDGGFQLVRVAKGYQFRTDVSFAPFVRELKASKPRRLSGAALETLSIIAYRQPVVRSDIEKIRGVDVTPTLKTLMDRGLIDIVGQQATVGQPALYGTTEEFLKLFGLPSLAELPKLRSFLELEQDPGESGEDDGEVSPEALSGEGDHEALVAN